MMIFGPIFGLIIAIRRGLNLKLLVPGIGDCSLFHFCCFCSSIPHQILMVHSFYLVSLEHYYQPHLLTRSFHFPREYTGISSAVTNMMRIVGGAIGPVITTVILASITVSITVDNAEGSYPSPVAFNIVFAIGGRIGNCICDPSYQTEATCYQDDTVNS